MPCSETDDVEICYHCNLAFILMSDVFFFAPVFQCSFSQGCHGQGKYLENGIFSRSGKVQEFCGWPGKFRKDLESQGKVREFENKWLRQAVFRKFIYSVQEGKGCTFS